MEDVAREVGVSKHTIYGWKAKYGGMDVHQILRWLRRLRRSFRLLFLLPSPRGAAHENVFPGDGFYILEVKGDNATPTQAACLPNLAYLSDCGSARSNDHVSVYYDVS